jgi:hypothetical protein
VAGAVEIAPGLQRWTARHEEWNEEVGSVAAETADGLVFIDPLAPPAGLGAPARSAQPVRNRNVPLTDVVRAGADLPGGIQAVQTPRASEVVYWLPGHGALVVGDVLLGAGAKPNATSDALRLCPERWLGRGTHDDLRAMLRPFLDLPVEHVLVSHGAPVVTGGHRALAAVLG